MATNEKYDRQLRLWGSGGQRALSETRVVLVNATAVGTETLKNLVLPGVGSFHVIDDRYVPSGRVGGMLYPSNFFAVPGAPLPNDDGDGGDEGSEKKGEDPPKSSSRAEVTCRFLSELNDDVDGSYEHVTTSLDDLDYDTLLRDAASSTGDGKNGSNTKNLLVVAADMSLRPLRRLASACWERDVPMLVVRSYGLIGSVRIQTRRHTIVESKPDTERPDLRLAGCFPELRSLADSVDLDSLDDKEHGHVPYVMILLKALDRWRADHDGSIPSTFAEKGEFKQSIKSMSRDFDKELNFNEAVDDAYLAYSNGELPTEVEELLEKSTIDDVRDGFDILVLALKRFLGEESSRQQPPLNGSIPDMTSSTSLYVKLQEAYKSRADADRARMRTLVDEISNELRTSGGGEKTIPEVSDEELTSFCRNVRNVRMLHTRSVEDELTQQTRVRSSPGGGGATGNAAADDGGEAMKTEDDEGVTEDLVMACMDPSDPPEHTPLLWHLAMRSCELFEMEHGAYPGADSRELALESDAREVQRNMVNVTKSLGIDEADLVKSSMGVGHAAEMVRYYNAELHNVASVVGGVASQEAVKLVTHQYVPIDNTFVYNGTAGTAAVYRF